MTDYFAVLQEPRRPWLDPGSLKENFTLRSAQVHPDRIAKTGTKVQEHDFTQLNAAYNCLCHPRSRLQHLIELETGTRPQQVQEIPGELMDTFMEVASACREADSILSRKPSEPSPLLQLEFFQIAQECAEKLAAIEQRVQRRTDKLLAEVRQIDGQWSAGAQDLRPKLLQQLSSIHRLLGYFERWANQLRERALQLTL